MKINEKNIYTSSIEYISVGASKRSNISDTYKNFIVFASKSNILICNSRRIIKRITCGCDEITFLKVKYNNLYVGNSEGYVYIFALSTSNDNNSVNLEKHYENKFDGAIVGFEEMNISTENYYIASTMDKIFLFDRNNILYEECCDDLISYSHVVKLDGYLHLIIIGCDSGNLITYEYKILSKKLDFNSIKNIHSSNIKCIKSAFFGNKFYFFTSSLDSSIKVFKINLQEKDESYFIEEISSLYGHKDWVFGCNWVNERDIISSSADNTVLYWEYREKRLSNKSEWVIKTRLGGTTEKNMAFYNALSLKEENKNYIIAQSISGGFYKYYQKEEDIGNSYSLLNYISGHLDEISSIDIRDDFILTSSLDSTTRIFSFYLKEEVGRPQIHGYPINSARFLKSEKFEILSGASETILRVYEATQVFLKNYIKRNQKKMENEKNIEIKNNNEKGNNKPENYQNSKEYNILHKIDDYPKKSRLSELSLTNEIYDNNFLETLSEGNNERNLSLNFVFSEKQKVYGHYFEIQDIAASPEYIISCNRSSSHKYSGIFIWKVLPNSLLEKCDYIQVHDLGVQRLNFSYDGDFFISCSRDKKVVIYKKNDVREICGSDFVPFSVKKVFESHKRIVSDCSISYDNKYAVSCSKDKKLIFYSIKKSEILHEMVFESEVTAVCFSPIRNLLAIGFSSGVVKLLEIIDDKEICEVSEAIELHSGPVNCIRFKSCGGFYVTGGKDSVINIVSIKK